MKIRMKPSLSQGGMALVEFAIVLPLLTLVLLGLIEIGRFTYYSIVVGNAARAGAQYGAYSSNTAQDAQGMHDAAVADGQNNVKDISAQGTFVCACWNSATGTESPAPPTNAVCGSPCPAGRNVTYAQVTTSGNYNALFQYPGLPATFTVTSRAIMRVHQ